MNQRRKSPTHRRLHAIAFLFALWPAAMGSPAAGAVAFTDGNLLITQCGDGSLGQTARLWEYTASGSLVQTIAVPVPDSFSSSAPRDLVVDRQGNAQIHDRLFGSRLTEYDPDTGAFNSRFADVPWHSWGTTRSGGIAIFGDYVFVPTQHRNYPDVGGIIRFDLRDNTSRFFATDDNRIFDLAMGYDGVLYALGPETSPGGNWIDRFDPITMQRLSYTLLPRELTAMAVAPNGHIFACDWSTVMELDQLGNLMKTWTVSGVAGLVDIDVDPRNRLAVASADGTVLVGDTSLTSFETFTPRAGYAHTGNVAFVQAPVPEPAAIALITPLLASVALRRRARPRMTPTA